jgi:cation diffusion facilitator CzcD-associated flavoprotein CzcO
VREIETDYLIVGAGASGMAFADALVAESDAEVVIVDRRHSPGGHWLDAYPFVRLHQPSAYYGVNSRVLGEDRIDATGPNAGFYERATAAEICDYFSRVLGDLVGSGRARFFAMTDYRGAHPDGHHLTSRLTGEETTVKVRRKLVDATYVESSIPSRHIPAFAVDAGVRMIPPNDLVDLDEATAGFTVLGAGKTAMDTCNWLLDAGVDPDMIQWFRPRDPWLFNREAMQPLELVGAYMRLQACWVEAAAEVENATEFTHALEAHDLFVRVDPRTEPRTFRGATISTYELERLRTIENTVAQRVLRLGTHRIVTDGGEIVTDPNRVYVDCTAPGVRPTIPRPVFEGNRITLQYVTIGIVPWSAAILGVVEAGDGDDEAKNRLCPPVVFTGEAADILHIAHRGMIGLMARAREPRLNAWTEGSRLNPARGAADHLDDPRVPAAFTSIATHIGDAMTNLERLAPYHAQGER